ncbi:MAG: hypothetical protein ACLP50_38310 [Solirubrobacteraceae bacterium]
MDLGPPISYELLAKGTPVLSRDGHQIGEVAHVLAAEDEDIFDGIVIAEHVGAGGHRFADADDIGEIHERGVLLKLSREASAQLPEPSANPAVMGEDPGDPAPGVSDKLKRAWDFLSGNY